MTGRGNTGFGDISDRAINEAHDNPIKPYWLFLEKSALFGIKRLILAIHQRS